MPAEPRTTTASIVGVCSQAASSCRVPITLMSCIARAAMPAPGCRTIWLCTTVSISVCGISLPIIGLRMSASMKSVRSSRVRGGRASRPATYSTLGSRSSRRASSLPRRVDTPVIRTRRPLTSSSAMPSSRASRCAWRDCGVRCGSRAGRRGSPARVPRYAAGGGQRLCRRRRPLPVRVSSSDARLTQSGRPPRAASAGPAPGVSSWWPSPDPQSVFHRLARVPGASSAIHLKPAAELAERVLLPGDPHRALAVAQDLMEQPKMFNHHRGLWGYTGTARDGEPLTVQATGMGGPSAAIVIEELIALGARTLIRIGTCGALTEAYAIGDVVAPEAALAMDGTSRALGAEGRVLPDPGLASACAANAPAVVAASVDVFYGDQPGEGDVVEMECATLFRIAELRSVRAAAVLGVSDALAGERQRICAEHLEALGLQLGEAAWAALVS